MTFTHWYRENEPKSPQKKTKVKPTLHQLDYRLGCAILEARSVNSLWAGLDKSMLGRTQFVRKKGGEVPSLFKRSQQYKHKRKIMLRQAQRLQRQVSEFRSKPVPNFSAHHRIWEKRNHIRRMNTKHKTTTAETPQTLLKSMESQKRWETKKMNIMRQISKELTLRPNISKHSTELWRKRPFLPRFQSSFVKAEPFQLRCEERAKQRRKFDEWHMQKQQADWRRRYLEWRRVCQDEYLAARKLTRFKARPNPWKHLQAEHIQDKK